MIERWLHAPVNMRELDSMGDGAERAARILARTPNHIDASMRLGRTLFGEYLHLFHSPRRRRMVLPSR